MTEQEHGADIIKTCCPNCGAGFTAGDRYCETCGYDLAARHSGDEDRKGETCSGCGTISPAEDSALCESRGGDLGGSLPRAAGIRDGVDKSNSRAEHLPDKVERRHRSPNKKKVGVAALLTILPGFVGLWGFGHFYAGRTMRGIVLLVVSLALFFVVFGVSFVFGALGGFLGAGAVLLLLQEFEATVLKETLGAVLYVVVGYSIIWGAVWLWQTIDACRAVQRWNRAVDEVGEKPW